MTDKYVREGETFNGDGSSSAAATVDGGVGSWNDYWSVFIGTPAYGSVVAGDTIHIKTTQQDDTSDVVIGTTVDRYGTAGADASDTGVITFKYDDGSVWVGAVGDFIVEIGSAGSSATNMGIGDFTEHLANHTLKNLTFKPLYIGTLVSLALFFGTCRVSGFVYDGPTPTGVSRTILGAGSTDVNILLDNFISNVRGEYNSTSVALLFNCTTRMTLRMTAFEINYLGGVLSYNQPMLSSISQAGVIELLDGKITGIAESTRLTVPGGNAIVTCINVQTPFSKNLLKQEAATEALDSQSSVAIHSIKIPGIKNEFIRGNEFAVTSWELENYPTLSATLPTGEPWSLKTYAPKVTKIHPWNIFTMLKTWNGGDNLLDITTELLLPSDPAAKLDDSTNEDIYVSVGYVDATTGDLKRVTTLNEFNPTLLTVSVAAWSSAVYGPTNFSKRKIVAQTPTSVKNNTDISITLTVVRRAPSTQAVIFTDPDVLLEVS